MKQYCVSGWISVLLLILFLLSAALPVFASDPSSALDTLLAGQMEDTDADSLQDWLDGSLSNGAGRTSEWYILALRQYKNGLDFSTYTDALDQYLSEHRIVSASSRQKIALAFFAAGCPDHPFVSLTCSDSIGKQGIMSWVYALHLLANGADLPENTADGILSEILSLRLEDGGWAITGSHADVDVTAITVQALALYADRENVSAAIDTALELLSQKQLDDGGFVSYGVENPESAAQVIVALTALGLDPTSEERFQKSGGSLLDGMLRFQLEDGSFCHVSGGESNFNATVQAFYALVALERFTNGLGPISVFDPISSPDVSADTQAAEKTPPETEAETSEDSAAVETAPEPVLPSELARRHSGSYKLPVLLCIVGVALLACILLWIFGKRHPKNFLFVLILAAAAAAFVLLTTFQSTARYYTAPDEKEKGIGTVMLTIRCDTVLEGNASEYIPADGVILPETAFVLSEDETVYDLLVEAARTYGIQLENNGTSDLAYISGLAYLYEFDYGDLSGWIYRVNGEDSSVGCSDYVLADGDRVEWLYTLRLGNDLGSSVAPVNP